MNHEFAFSAKHPHVPRTERWLASISDGRTIFQDRTPGKLSAWKRLQETVSETDLYLTNVRLEAYGQKIISVPYRHPETGEAQVDGYWFSCKKSLLAHPTHGGEFDFIGLGFIRNGEIYITWVRQDGHILHEVRNLHREDGSIEPGAILQCDTNQ